MRAFPICSRAYVRKLDTFCLYIVLSIVIKILMEAYQTYYVLFYFICVHDIICESVREIKMCTKWFRP